MAKKISPSSMDALFGSLTGRTVGNDDGVNAPSQSAGHDAVIEDAGPARKKDHRYTGEQTRMCTLIDSVLFEKVRALAQSEGLTVRSIIEYALGRAVDTYEEKHGRIRLRKTRKGNVNDVFS